VTVEHEDESISSHRRSIKSSPCSADDGALYEQLGT